MMKASLAIVFSILIGVTAAQPQAKFVKLRMHNAAKVDIQVYVVDKIAKTTDESNKRTVTPNGVLESKAMLDPKGYINIVFSILGKDDKNVSVYRCYEISTSTEGKSELSYDLSMQSGRSC
jgi:hypothetical protein